jgi:hypothetical protein
MVFYAFGFGAGLEPTEERVSRFSIGFGGGLEPFFEGLSFIALLLFLFIRYI